MSVGNIVVGYFATEHEKEMVDIDLEELENDDCENSLLRDEASSQSPNQNCKK